MGKKTNKPQTRTRKEQERTTKGKERVLEALDKSLGIVTTACANAGVSQTQFYEWKRTDAEFAEAVKAIDNKQMDFVEGKLLQNIKDNDTQSILFYLRTKGKSRGYTERTELQVEVPVFNDNRSETEILGIMQERMKLHRGEE